MKREKIEELVRAIVVEQLQVHPEQVTTGTLFVEDLSADSLDSVELVMAFEEQFNIEIPPEAEEKMRTVGAVVDWLEASLVGQE
jgi:acyl carrier protein